MKKAIKGKNIDGDKKNSKGNKKKKFKKAVILFVIIGIAVIGMLFAKVIIPAQNATKKYNIAVKEYNNEAENIMKLQKKLHWIILMDFQPKQILWEVFQNLILQ